ncbi:argininosuccinate lyase [Rhodobacter sp. HX-7-19]|uniref:Argininosuccinate lyase n=1 Tax=Paragemmobacter kunshanensis TaxID=2583234 RepID=A0A6M1THP2_9RHOB|nr:argininosuccinate lyase [Rhodobacter kunshanensis]NGQ89379.1 argininosuccinate lyase [Rhodobacter kunshanensis]
MKPLFTLATLALLAGCGADGPPVAPSQAAATGLAATGQVQVGVTGGN